jgi:type IV pilus assembly protein PilX
MTLYEPYTRQRGFVLMLTLIFMVVLTILGLGLGIATTDEEKMARNFRDRDVAFAAAEAAMRDAELRLTGAYKSPYDLSATSPLVYNDTCANALCDSTVAQAWQPVDQLDFFSNAGTGALSKPIGDITGSPTMKGLSSFSLIDNDQPRYMIERIRTTITNDGGGSVYAYRITIQARGRLPNTRVTLQEIFIPNASYEVSN